MEIIVLRKSAESQFKTTLGQGGAFLEITKTHMQLTINNIQQPQYPKSQNNNFQKMGHWSKIHTQHFPHYKF